MSDLDKLIKAVEAGTFLMDVLSPEHELTAYDAFSGSLDAALRLHEALVPRWAVDDMSQNGRLAGHPWGIRLAYWDVYRPAQNKHIDAGWGADSIPDQIPARAWLLAILKALRAKEAEE